MSHFDNLNKIIMCFCLLVVGVDGQIFVYQVSLEIMRQSNCAHGILKSLCRPSHYF